MSAGREANESRLVPPLRRLVPTTPGKVIECHLYGATAEQVRYLWQRPGWWIPAAA